MRLRVLFPQAYVHLYWTTAIVMFKCSTLFDCLCYSNQNATCLKQPVTEQSSTCATSVLKWTVCASFYFSRIFFLFHCLNAVPFFANNSVIGAARTHSSLFFNTMCVKWMTTCSSDTIDWNKKNDVITVRQAEGVLGTRAADLGIDLATWMHCVTKTDNSKIDVFYG